MRKMVLNPDVRSALSQIKTADILVGIPSFNNAGTIGHVVRAVKAGLAKYFPEHRCVIVNSDGGSTDGTPDVVLQEQIYDYETILVQHPLFPIHKISTPYDGIPGKGSAFRTIFRIAEEVQAEACAVLDADLRSVTPEWVELLIRPVLDGRFDYVTPYYLRHKFDGTITNSIVHPLTREFMAKIDFQHGGPEYDAKYPDGIPTTLEIEHRTLGKLSSGLVMYPEGHARNTSGHLPALLEHKFRKLAGLGVRDVAALERRLKDLGEKSADEIRQLYSFEIEHVRPA